MSTWLCLQPTDSEFAIWREMFVPAQVVWRWDTPRIGDAPSVVAGCRTDGVAADHAFTGWRGYADGPAITT